MTEPFESIKSLAEVSGETLKPVLPAWLERVAPLIEKPVGGVQGVPSNGLFEQN
jgi:hypothetical protein